MFLVLTYVVRNQSWRHFQNADVQLSSSMYCIHRQAQSYPSQLHVPEA